MFVCRQILSFNKYMSVSICIPSKNTLYVMSAYGFRSSGILAPTVYKSTSNNEVIFVTFELRPDV